MRWLGLLVITLMAASEGLAQLPTFNLGRTPSADEIRAQDITVGPSGKELPPGRGTAKEGAAIFEKRCAHCHGVNGAAEGQFPALSGPKARVVNYPFATTIWDFINSAMPRKVPDIGTRDGSLTAAEVYSLTAFVLYRNNIVKEMDVLDASSLPKIKMPKRDPHLDKVAPR
ncbi:MAG: cytochrome c [Acidobacteria bacterium]|nr:cytochrome c [Acidobacteriota bacterium]